jgi:Golgi nucleoside diphosphatase
MEKHYFEAEKSWDRFQIVSRRRLKHKHEIRAAEIEEDHEEAFLENIERSEKKAVRKRHKKKLAHEKLLHELYAHPGITTTTTHGIMIDAGSTGSRMHIYEWAPRVLRDSADIEAAVSGNKLSFPTSESRWTDRLRPGLSEFSSIQGDDELQAAIADYLHPLMDFARTVMHSKVDEFDQFPIFLRATAGMRTLSAPDRARVMTAVRNLFHNHTFCPFQFVDEQARVLSGEEEAVYDFAGVNFLMGDLLSQSEGQGTVRNPSRTHGALDLGGASTQISFYEVNEDIMSNLFKFQIGQAKHWNIYAHSFLFYGMNEAINRFHAQLSAGRSRQERMIDGVYNPCLPGGSKQEIRTNIHFSDNGVETWDFSGVYPSGNGFYQAILVNKNERGDADLCLQLTENLLHLEKNDWCAFAHKGDCSLAGIYQPKLPRGDSFAEFIAFSNYYHVWKFLGLPERATIAQLEESTRKVCAMSKEELIQFNDANGRVDGDLLDSYCFRSAYALKLLNKGYGFGANDTIRALELIEGQKVGWALGSLLYEINTMPWTYQKKNVGPSFVVNHGTDNRKSEVATYFLVTVVIGMILSLIFVFARRERKLKRMYDMYEPVKDVSGGSVSLHGF